MAIMTKVLVFESDHAFAEELRSELGKLDCTVHVVDDGNVGLALAAQDRPDLILLAIELPRMNGFSVCNKLKKDPLLKDVPLVIMSSESPEDTFEQHRKLRTRAEDYVHKPIAFGELLERIRAFLPLGAGDVGELDDDIVIDDSIDLLEPEPADEQTVQLVAPSRLPSARPPPVAPRVDAEVDAFIGGAFDRLLGEEDDERTQVRSMGEVYSAIQAARRPTTMPPPAPTPRPVTSSRARTTPPPSSAEIMSDGPPMAQFRVADHPPAPAAAQAAEVERLRGELERAKLEVVHMTKEVGAAQAAARRSEGAAGEMERLHREIDDLKQRLSAGGSKPGVSSREFLDLRETLNKKDKELLAMRDQVSRKEKDILDLRDQLLSFERERADHADRALELERAAADLATKAEALQTDRDLAAKRGEEWRERGDKLEQQLTASTEELTALRAGMASMEVAQAAALEEAAAGAAQRIAAAEQGAERAIEEARGQAHAERARIEAEHRAAVEAADAAHRATLSAAEARAAETLAAREAALVGQHAQATEAGEARFAEALAQARTDADQRAAAAEAAHSNALAEALADADRRFGVAETAHEMALASVQESADKVLADAVAAHAAASEAWASESRDLRAHIAELGAAVAQQTAEAASAASDLAKSRVTGEQQRERAEAAEQLGREQAAEINQLVAARDGLRAEGERLTAELGREKVLLEKARRKWGEDRVSLERAREALAMALGKIEEAEGRPME
jgi:CheY-like chemotaxis protein